MAEFNEPENNIYKSNGDKLDLNKKVKTIEFKNGSKIVFHDESVKTSDQGRGVTPWNKGKRKPITDEFDNKWCNCVTPKLTNSGSDDKQAYCLLCHNYWYN